MIATSGMDHMEDIVFNHGSCPIITSSSLIEKYQECFLIITKLLFIEPSCSKNCCDFILSPNHTSCLEEENNVKEEGFDCEIIPSVELIDSQLKPIMNVLKEEEIPFKEDPFENVSFSREAFHFLTSSTYYFCIMIFLMV
jgi:hypothetical protein